jgi:RecA DNA recombination protein
MITQTLRNLLIVHAKPRETWPPLEIAPELGFPRGALTEIYGSPSSGRTSLLHTALAAATAGEEVCALVDTSDAFDPESAAAAGVALDQLLWVRCGGNAEHALRVTDLLIQAGGFGLVAMDLGDTPPRTARRISLTSWYRLRRAIEHTRTSMVVLGLEPYARQCASLSLEARRGRTEWSRLFDGAVLHFEPRKPAGRCVSLAKMGQASACPK